MARTAWATARDGERQRREELAAPFPEPLPLLRRQRRHVQPRRPDPERVGLPPVVERRATDLDGELAAVGVRQAGSGEQPREVALPRPGQPRLVPDPRGDVVRGGPERVQRAAPAGVVPDAGGDGASGPGDADHLGEAAEGIRHEVHDELRQHDVERAVAEGQLLGRGLADVDVRESAPGCRDEGWRGLDGGHPGLAEAVDEDGGEGARAATDVQRPGRRGDDGEVGEADAELLGVATHEAAVGVGAHIEHGDHRRPPCGRRAPADAPRLTCVPCRVTVDRHTSLGSL